MNARVWSATNASRSDVAQKLHDVAVSQNLHSAPKYINLFKNLDILKFDKIYAWNIMVIKTHCIFFVRKLNPKKIIELNKYFAIRCCSKIAWCCCFPEPEQWSRMNKFVQKVGNIEISLKLTFEYCSGSLYLLAKRWKFQPAKWMNAQVLSATNALRSDIAQKLHNVFKIDIWTLWSSFVSFRYSNKILEHNKCIVIRSDQIG